MDSHFQMSVFLLRLLVISCSNKDTCTFKLQGFGRKKIPLSFITTNLNICSALSIDVSWGQQFYKVWEPKRSGLLLVCGLQQVPGSKEPEQSTVVTVALVAPSAWSAPWNLRTLGNERTSWSKMEAGVPWLNSLPTVYFFCGLGQTSVVQAHE